MTLEKIALSEISAVIPLRPVTPSKARELNPLSDFPFRYRGLSLAQCKETEGNQAALQAARDWADGKIDNLFLYGLNGTGKTHIACAAIAERFGDPLFINVPTMLLKFQASVKEHDELELIGELTGYTGRSSYAHDRRPDLRLFDDLAAHRISDFALEMFGLMLEKLYSNCSSGMIFTSNLSPKQIMENMGERISSRLVGLAHPIKIEGKDWRLNSHV